MASILSLRLLLVAFYCIVLLTLTQGQVQYRQFYRQAPRQAFSLRPHPFGGFLPLQGNRQARTQPQLLVHQPLQSHFSIRPESTLVLPQHQIPTTIVTNVATSSSSSSSSNSAASQQVNIPNFATPELKPQCPTGACQVYTRCAQPASAPNRFCLLSSGFTGICCADLATAQLSAHHQNLTAFSPRYPTHPVEELPGGELPSAPKYPTEPEQRPTDRIQIDLSEVRNIIAGWDRLEDELVKNEIWINRGTKEFSHQNFFGGNELSQGEAKSAIEVLLGFRSWSKSKGLSSSQISGSNFDLRNTNLANTCGPAPTCVRSAKYRTPDGTCNNLQKASQGKTVSTFGRLLPPEYQDGVSEPKRALDGGELPNARLVSLTIAPDARLESGRYSLLLMQFGQFVDHDLTRSAVTQTHTGGSISCCDAKVLASPRLRHPACFSIPVPAQDTFLLGESQSCIDFVRSAPAVNPRCRFGPREQLNQLSAYIDGNNIYGASKKQADNLREFRGGLLKITRIGNEEFLPQNANDTSCVLPKNSELKCFQAGDGRVNEVLDLAVLHTVFMREHNRVARVLAKLNPTWSDEILYQETKRIVVAEFQHIIYNEFLPLILGQRAWAHFGLQVTEQGYSQAYNPAIDASILNEFATAAYRLHSLVAGSLQLKDNNRDLGKILLRNQFNNPEILYHRNGYEMRIESLTGQAIQSFDNFFTKELTNHLFQAPGKRFGLDLVALNIQRGRDHGLPGYVKYREICGLSRINSFQDLKRVFSNPQVPDVMSQLYERVEDIDLFIAGTSERVMPGAVVGPTFACIIGEQFRRVKEGDRFWYENPNQPGSFSPRQLAEIKQASLARILCDNSNLGEMQPNALLVAGPNNPKLSCLSEHIPYVNLKAWRQ